MVSMMTSRIVQVLCLLFCLLSFSSAQAQTPAPGLSLTNCTSNNVSSPTASTMSCTLTNSGVGAISSISYSTLAGMTVSGPTSCSASASCGMVRMTTGTTAGAYNGSLTITPNTGAAVVLPVNLAVYASDAVLNLRNCTQVNPTVAPTAATMSCALRKMSSPAINSLTYTSPAGTTISGPASCTGTVLACGTVSITTATTPGNYTGNATVTPNTGAAASLPINLTVTTTPAVLSFKACSDVTPTVTPQRASTTCTLGNTGGAVSSITYSSGLPMGSNITGPSSCAANSDCGTVTVTTRLTTGTYTGTMSATPNAGSAATRPINLSVVAALTGLNLKSCVDVNPSEAPNQASTSCTLNNASATAVTSISYAGLPATMDITGPSSCAASADCGTVLVRSGNAVGIYSGTLTITPNTGAVVNKTISLQVNQAAVALSLKSCNTSNVTTIAPTAASRNCVLRNNGSSTISIISYTPPVGQTVVGPTSCGANADCGTITSTSETIAKAYNGNVTITPNSGSAITMPSNLRVNTDTMLNLTACTDVTSTNAPTPAKTTCTLTNTGGTNASTITYSGLTGTGLTASGPATCAANSTCGDVIISSGDVARTYNGTLTVAAATGTAATKVAQLVVNPALVLLTLESCEVVSPTISPARASRSCDLRNRGTSPATLTYALPVDSLLQLQAPTPSSCPANGLCGKVTITTPTTSGVYSGDLQITPNIGTGTLMRSMNLQVNKSPANLALVDCSSNSPTSFPTAGRLQCSLRNHGDTNANTITYVKEAWMIVNGPTSCTGKSDCGQVVINSPMSAGSFTGNITLTPDNGTGVSLPVNLQVSGTPAKLVIASCSVQSPTYTNSIPFIDCALQNTGETEISSITYSALSTVRLKKSPVSCKANDYCDQSVRIVLDYQGVYSGNLVITPNAGPSVTLPYRLEMVALGTPLLSMTIAPSPLNLIADNTGKASGITTVNVTGGSQPYTYNWVRKSGTRSTALNATTNSPTISATLTPQENFQEIWTVTVRDAANITGTQDLTVNFTDNTPIPLTASIAPSSPITLAVNAPAVASTILTVTPNGGTAPYSYNWTRTSGSISTLTSNQIANPVVSASVKTGDNFQEIWKVTVTDATNNSTTASVTLIFKANVVTPAPILTITRNPNDNPWIVGQRYTTTIASTNATTVAYNCVVDDNNADGYKGSGTTDVNGPTGSVTAISSWVGHPSTCTWTATGPGGNTVVTEKLTTVSPPAGPPAIVNFNASNTNIRVATGQSGNVTFTGEASQSGGRITKLELFSNNGSGYGATPVESVSGTTSSLSINTTVPVSAGSYRFKLRATNQAGTTAESTETIINVTDSALLGEISGIRTNQTDSSKLELFGWACQDTNSAPLNYKVYVNAPANLGGIEIATGTANIANQHNDTAVRNLCHTAGAAHHFVLDLTDYATPHAGKRLFVEVATANNALKATLTCADYSCTMPGALRIGLTTPKNNDRYTGPATVSMLVKIANSTGPFDELAVYINGEWVNAARDETAGEYMYLAKKSGVPSNTLPYPVYAKVRQGNTTIYSAENLIYVDAINDGVTVNMIAPLDNQEATMATPITLDTEVIPTQGSTAQIAAVKFFVNGAVLASATGPVSNRWTYNWTPNQLGVMSVKAQAFNADGKMLGESNAVKVNVIEVSDLIPASATPLEVKITPPYLSSADAGSLPGNLGVDKNGSANYSIPIALPPGTNGMVPSLSLNYSSDNTTGSAGLGWSLGGISNIDRCGKTVAVDGVADAVKFESYVRVGEFNLQPTDRLCLDGQRLILVSGNVNDNFAYWANGAEYRTEIESFNKVTAITVNGKRAFKVVNKAGQTMYYGNTDDSYVIAVDLVLGFYGDGTPNLAHRWRLSRSIDRSGNSIDYYYTDPTTGESKPKEIRWGGQTMSTDVPTDRSTNNHYAKVTLLYESRPDKRTAFVGGARNDENLRLKTIFTSTDTNTSGSGGTPANNYNLTYELSPTSGRSLLRTVAICEGDTTTKCLPATSFTWGEPNPSATKGFEQLGADRVGPNIAAFGQNLKPNNDSSKPGGKIFPMKTLISGDFNGDGKTDLLERYRLAGNGQQQSLYTSDDQGASWTKTTPFAHLSGDITVMETGDFDGDGKLDVLIANQTIGNPAISNWAICPGKLNTPSRFECTQAVSFPSDAIPFEWHKSLNARLVADFNADGKDDIYFRQGEIAETALKKYNAYTCLSTGTGFNCIQVARDSRDIGGTIDMGDVRSAARSSGNVYSDINGDGRVDKLTLERCTREIRPPDDPNAGELDWLCGAWGNSFGNIVITSQAEPFVNAGGGEWFEFPDNQTVILPPLSSGTLTGDFSADGYSDIVFGTVKMKVNGYHVESFGSHICLSRGNGGGECKALPSSGLVNGLNLDHFVVNVNDYDGDGIQDVLRPASNLWSNDNISGYRLCRIGTSGNFHQCEAWSGPEFKALRISAVTRGFDIPYEAIFDRMHTTFMGDFNGDGKQDLLVYHGDPNGFGQDKWQVFSAADQAKPGEALDKLISVTNGLGLEERVTYAKANDTTVVKPGAILPNGQDAVSGKRSVPHRQVVKGLHKSTGNGYWLDTEYSYAGFAVDPTGRGSLGFAQVTSYDVQDSTSNITWYYQEFPYSGTPRYQRSFQGRSDMGPIRYLVDSSTVMANKPLTQNNGQSTYLPYSPSSTTAKRDLDGSAMGSTVTTTSEPDTYGNSTTITSVTTDPSNQQFTSQQIAVYTQKVWPLSQLDKVTETKKVGTLTAPARTIDYTYDTKGLVATEEKQKGSTSLAVKTSYDRSGNSFGLVNKTTINYQDPILGNLTKTVAEVIYTTNGRFPQTVKNALGHYETKAFDPKNGAPISNTDINGLTTTWQVDGFGRKLKHSTSDGTDVYTYQKQCAPNCPSGAVSVLVNDTKRGSVRVAVPSLVFSDSAGHPIRSITWGFDGSMIGSQTVYDSQGRVYESYHPRFITNMVTDDVAYGAVMAVRNHYDELNRFTQTDIWDDAELRSNFTTYNGLATTIKNAKGQSKTETRDVWGRLTESLDANGKSTKYEYDPYNNLTKTTDPLLNVVTIDYDALGRRTKLSDPDLGINDYELNPLGQVIKQTSPVQRRKKAETTKEHATTMRYDDLGRMIERQEYDLKGYWVYDKQLDANCRMAKSCGKLIESYTHNGSVKDNQQTHTYDSLGRPDSTTLQRDVSYVHRVEYDAWGRPLKETQQRASETAKVFERRYNAYGYQHQVLRAKGSGYQVLWQANEQDASQRLRKAALGNLLKIEREYYARSGHLQSALLLDKGDHRKTEESYSYDALGNVNSRLQKLGADINLKPEETFTELFVYDDLNRLKKASVTGFADQDFSYDDIGNITNKTGIGSYSYPASGNTSFETNGASTKRPHAVSSIASLGSFTYDDNGNLINGAGRSISWTSFDMPMSISKGLESSSFRYGADHQRTVQIKTDASGIATNIYYAGAMEVETKNGTVQSIKTYWPGGLGFDTDKPGQATALQWVHTDRIGSVIAMTNSGGALVERLAYDSWGKRRSLSGSETPDSIDGVIDNKGFTGHEMLDKLDLVHMNGRIYDPLVARFMSADPIIQDPMHSQSYNRYTYVWNNPTNLTDPTGFMAANGNNVASASTPESDPCDMACRENRRRYDECKANPNCSHYGTTGYENSPSNGKDKTGRGWVTKTCVSGSTGECATRTPNSYVSSCSPGIECVGVAPKMRTLTSDLLIEANGGEDSPSGMLIGKAIDAYDRGDKWSSFGYSLLAGLSMYGEARQERILNGGVSSGIKGGKLAVINGNSNASQKTQHGYEIVDTHNGIVAKTGISGQPLNKNDTSPRANSQANSWNNEQGNHKRYVPRVIVIFPAGQGARQAAKQWEVQNATDLRKQGQLDPARHTIP